MYKYKFKGKSNPKITTPEFNVIEEILIPNKPPMTNWYSLYLVFQSISKYTGIASRKKISIRKYQINKQGKEIRKQCYNLNTVNEARALLKLIIKYFPEATIE